MYLTLSSCHTHGLCDTQLESCFYFILHCANNEGHKIHSIFETIYTSDRANPDANNKALSSMKSAKNLLENSAYQYSQTACCSAAVKEVMGTFPLLQLTYPLPLQLLIH